MPTQRSNKDESAAPIWPDSLDYSNRFVAADVDWGYDISIDAHRQLTQQVSFVVAGDVEFSNVAYVRRNAPAVW